VTRLPRALTLPSGLRVRLRAADPAPGPRPAAPSPPNPTERPPLFADALACFDEGRITLLAERSGERLDVRALPLGDFHVLRAVLIRAGHLEEDEVEVSCRNCDAPMKLLPCAGLEIGPWVDDELDDEELDATAPFGAPIEVAAEPDTPGQAGRPPGTHVTFAARTVGDAEPAFRALAQPTLVLDAALVEALGIASIGSHREASAIAEALAAASDETFAAVGDAFLASHYVPRLGCIAVCEACGARNDVDAPYLRELEPAHADAPRHADRAAPSFPSFDAFASRAKVMAGAHLSAMKASAGARGPGDASLDVEVFVEGGTPMVDDGGEPLLGSYLPPHPGDGATPSRAPLVTVYYRTFRAMWNEEGPYDWEDELEETIEHELEHHVYFLRGDDPMDDEERAAIRDEALRVVGRREAGRRMAAGFGESVADFLRRTWPLWVLAALALAFTLVSQR